jgi:HPt (histidine-containing phosphotransfer) domain-containing protein
VNLGELDATLGRELVDELIAVYRSDLATRLTLLRNANDPEQVRRHAHGLRSGASTFGATALADAARALEHGDGGTMAAVEDAARELDAELATRAPSRPLPARGRA